MPRVRPLGKGWSPSLASLLAGARSELIIVSPYVASYGTTFLLNHISSSMRTGGRLLFVTDLSAANVCQTATDPAALLSLVAGLPGTVIRHLARVHAKVYVADGEAAIVTSGNLTAGGLRDNFEYGIALSDPVIAAEIRSDLVEFAELGALVSRERLAAYCRAAAHLRTALEQQRRSALASARRQFAEAVRSAEDELIRMRLEGGAMHTVFARTLRYLLKNYGPLTTEELHPLVAGLHPDLCDDTVDRVIDGKHFGKKWKHAVRTAQQQLRKQKVIALRDGRWLLEGDGAE